MCMRCEGYCTEVEQVMDGSLHLQDVGCSVGRQQLQSPGFLLWLKKEEGKRPYIEEPPKKVANS